MLFVLLCVKTDAGQIGNLYYDITDGEVIISGCYESAEGEVVIPAEIEGLPVTSIQPLRLSDCQSLTSISVTSGNSFLKSLDGVVFSKDLKQLLRCPAGKSGNYNVPEGVTSIENGAFNWCSSLTSIAIPAGVTSIGSFAFSFCSSLTLIIIPDSVISIGEMAFRRCSSLPSIIIPEGVTSIGRQAFAECSSLTSITIQEGITSIGDAAFYGCSSLTSITIPAAFHSQSEANRLAIGHLWPDGFFLPSSLPRKSPELSIRLAPVITVTGELDEAVTIEVADTADGPWTEWRTVIIGEDGTTEVDLDAEAEKRFYRIRN